MNTSTQLPEGAKLAAALSRELIRGERVLWQAMPDPGRMRIAYAIWIFAIPWTLFALAWTGIALTAYLSGLQSQGASVGWWGWIGPVWGLPFIAVGFWMMYMPIKVRKDARQTIHALTDQRLITLTVTNEKTLKSVALDRLGPITCKEKDDGWGSLIVETGSHKDSDGDRVTDRFEIAGVPDVASLHRLLLDQRAGV